MSSHAMLLAYVIADALRAEELPSDSGKGSRTVKA